MQRRNEVKSSSHRGKRPVLLREFVCQEKKNDDSTCNSSFRTESELKKHVRVCHRYVICGYCDMLLTYESYKTSHLKRHDKCHRKDPIACNKFGRLPADWTIPDDFLKRFKRTVDQSDTQSGESTSELQIAEDALQLSEGSATPDASSLVEKTRSIEMSDIQSRSADSFSCTSDLQQIVDKLDHPVPIRKDTLLEEPGTSCFGNFQGTPTFASSKLQARNRCMETSSFSALEELQSPDEQSTTGHSKNWRMEYRDSSIVPDDDTVEIDVCDIMGPTITSALNSMICKVRNEVPITSAVNSMISQEREKVPEFASSDTFWLKMIKQVTFGESALDMTLELEEIRNLDEIEGSIFQTINKTRVRLNIGVLQLWHLLDNRFALKNSTWKVPFGDIDGHVLYKTLQYLHSGEGILEARQLIKFLNGGVMEAVNALLIGLMTLCSIQMMPTDQFIIICESVSVINDAKLQKLVQLFCAWRVLRDKTDISDSSEFRCDLMQSLQRLVTQAVENETFRRAELMDVYKQITQHLSIMEGFSRMMGYPRVFQFECTAGQVPTLSQDFFLAQLITSVLEGRAINVLLHVVRQNCDPYNKDYDTCFEINVLLGSKTMKRNFYIHSLVLHARLGIDASRSKDYIQQIKEALNDKIFVNNVVLLFLKLLHDNVRNDVRYGSEEFKQLVELASIFKITSIPRLLYGYEEPTTPGMMKMLIDAYISVNDSAGLARMCRRLLDKHDLLAALDVNTMIEVLKRDDLALGEIEVYKLVVRYSSWGHCVDEKADNVPPDVSSIFNQLRKVVRFGIISLKDFDENVYDDPYLDPNLSSAFRHNIYWTMKGKPSRLLTISNEFIKPNHPRCAF